MSILAYHIVNDPPEMLNTPSKAHTTIMEGTPYEQSYDNYNTSSKVENVLKGTDGISRPDLARLLTHTATTKG